MNARQRCRARRHARRENERSILAATGGLYGGGSITPLYNVGHAKPTKAITAR